MKEPTTSRIRNSGYMEYNMLAGPNLPVSMRGSGVRQIGRFRLRFKLNVQEAQQRLFKV